jgi:UDP-2-acetamido-3-amino-2,3-dideoxy-glucuronate N-acetyltransferase
VPISSDVIIGNGVVIIHKELVNLYGCRIGDGTKIGAFVEVQRNATIGKNCKISSHTFVCEGVEMEDEVFVGHGVMFTNDRYPRATAEDGRLQTDADWQVLRTRVCRRASIGVSAIVGAAALVSRDVPDFAIVAGNPACVIGDVRNPPKGQ